MTHHILAPSKLSIKPIITLCCDLLQLLTILMNILIQWTPSIHTVAAIFIVQTPNIPLNTLIRTVETISTLPKKVIRITASKGTANQQHGK